MLDPGTQRQRCGYAAALYLCLARITIVGKQVIAAADREAALPRARRERNRNSQASEASSVTHSTPLSDDKPQPLNWMAAAAHQDLNVVAPSRTTKDSSPALFLTGSGDMRFEPVHTSSLSADAEFTSPASFWDRPNSARSDLGPGQPSHPRCNSFACPNADVHGISAPDESWLDKLSAFFGGVSALTLSISLLWSRGLVQGGRSRLLTFLFAVERHDSFRRPPPCGFLLACLRNGGGAFFLLAHHTSEQAKDRNAKHSMSVQVAANPAHRHQSPTLSPPI
mmetsp:Transcript_45798/g.91654  ORF Transcript_45798/g.91654 Transcript_45798/m.91654 type:complete len:281 (+) Transcript_45798:143-985(+)